MELSVVVVSYNTKKLLKQCLESIFKHTKGVTFEVIVADNASTDGSLKTVEKFAKENSYKFVCLPSRPLKKESGRGRLIRGYSHQFVSPPKKTLKKKRGSGGPIRSNLYKPTITLIANRANLGFAGANNQGIKIAQGKYILLLNSDTKLQENSFKKMIDWMEKNKKVGISSCQLIYKNGSIQRTGGFFPTLTRVFAWMFFIDDLPFIKELIKPFHPHEPRTGWLSSRYFQRQHLQDWVTGAFLLMRKKVVEQIGGLDESFFMYMEEVEFCYRAKKAGWQIAYVPLTKIIHLVRKSGSQAGALLGEYRGLVYFYKKHKTTWEISLLKMFLKLGALLRLLIFGIIMADHEKRKIYAQALAVN